MPYKAAKVDATESHGTVLGMDVIVGRTDGEKTESVQPRMGITDKRSRQLVSEIKDVL